MRNTCWWCVFHEVCLHLFDFLPKSLHGSIPYGFFHSLAKLALLWAHEVMQDGKNVSCGAISLKRSTLVLAGGLWLSLVSALVLTGGLWLSLNALVLAGGLWLSLVSALEVAGSLW